ncbi:hypothetical protein E4U42_006731, partial [Claviceps africana]
MAIEGFDLIDPDFRFEREGDFRPFLVEKISDFLVGYTANLMIMVHNLSVLIADTPSAGFHKLITCLIFRTDVAIYSSPACIAIARAVGPHRPVSASGERATYYRNEELLKSSHISK